MIIKMVCQTGTLAVVMIKAFLRQNHFDNTLKFYLNIIIMKTLHLNMMTTYKATIIAHHCSLLYSCILRSPRKKSRQDIWGKNERENNVTWKLHKTSS